MALNGPIISVEDDEDDQHLIQLAINSLQLPNALRFFPNGEEALDYLLTTADQPFIIICDINMPIMNGLEFRQRINQNEYLREKSIPFVFLTTAANKEVVRIAYDETVQGFYKKAPDYGTFQQQIGLIMSYWRSCLHPNHSGL
jgi:CheY-like chemotaxis protein